MRAHNTRATATVGSSRFRTSGFLSVAAVMRDVILEGVNLNESLKLFRLRSKEGNTERLDTTSQK